MIAIGRVSDSDRAFPWPTKDFYEAFDRSDGSDAPASPGEGLLRLANAPLGQWSRWTGLGLDPAGQVARLFSLHRLAFEAELNGELRRADFFWHEAHSELARLCRRPQVWESIWQSHGKPAFVSPEELRTKMILEIFGDIHAGFANSELIANATLFASARAFVHVQYFREVLRLSGMLPAEQARQLAPALQAQIDALLKARDWDQAIVHARELFDMAPDSEEFQDRLATTYFSVAVESLSPESDGNELAEAEQLQKPIARMHELRRLRPYNTLVYELIGQLEQIRAIRLANGKSLPEALVAARKGQILCPASDAARSLNSQLVELMGELQKQAEQVEMQLRQASNATLTADGHRMLAQARQGFGPLEAYLKTEEPEQIATARQKAQARAIWLEIGLAPDETEWDTRAAALIETTGSIFTTEPAMIEALAAAFEREAAARPELAGIDPQAVARFVKRRREPEPSKQTDAAPDKAPITVAGAEFPVIALPRQPAKRDREPLGYWLFGRQDYGARLTAVLAIAAVIGVAAGAVFDLLGSQARASAYAAIVAAAPQNDDRTVREQTARFLAAATLRQSDARETHVRALLADASEVPNRRIRDQAVKAMQVALEREDRLGVLSAIASFAAAPPLQQKEPRAAQLRDIYAGEFLRWFAGLEEAAGSEAASRSETYRRTAAALNRMVGDKP